MEQALCRLLLPQQLCRHHRLGRILRLLAPAILRLQLSFENWLWAKLWVFMPLSFLFTITQIPMLLRHGLALEDRDEVVKDEPPTA